ncbi:MAG: MFS transporter [Thermoleophilia bacterium]|nr:MFS transporter [Thermoleophilia bacterium]
MRPDARAAAVTDPACRARVQRRTIRVLVASQVVSAVGFTAGITVGALLGEDMIGEGWSGLPAGVYTMGSAVAALAVAEAAQARGRRVGLSAGYAAGALGGAGTVLAAVTGSVALLLVALFVYGAGVATTLLARYAGADLATGDARGRAISTVLVATTLGAVVGPNLVGPSGRLGEAIGVPSLAGPFLVAAVSYAVAAGLVFALLRPDPLLVARAAAAAGEPAAGRGAGAGREDPSRRNALVAGVVLLVAQGVMLGVMTLTPVHMREHGQSVSAAGLVISLHIGAMFLPSPLSGRIADRHGRRVAIAAGTLILALAGLAAAAAPDDSAAALAGALILLGLGWNLCVVGATALLTDAVAVARRARVQGLADVGVALAGAAGALGSGVVEASQGFAALGLLAAALALALIPLLAVVPRARPLGAAAEG